MNEGRKLGLGGLDRQADEGGLDGNLMRSIGAPVFQFYADLPSAINAHKILNVTDSRGILSHDTSANKWFWRTDAQFQDLGSPEPVLILTDSGNALLGSKTDPKLTRVFNLRHRRAVQLVHSPIFEAAVSRVNEAGWICGWVWAKADPTKTYSRVWDPSGMEIVSLGAPFSRITTMEPYETSWTAGYVVDSPTIWCKSAQTTLRLPDGSRGFVANVTGSGMAAGWVEDAGKSQAVVWSSDGSISYLRPKDEWNSKVLAVLEDNSFVVELIDKEGGKSYLVGRGDQAVPFESRSLKSIEGFPIVSVDGVSPSGIMVVTIMEPISKGKTRVLVGPEAFRADSR